METPEYLHLKPGDILPQLEGASPFKSVVVVEAEVTSEWQNQVSAWLVDAGCRYMMAWGKNASSWEDCVDYANNQRFGFGDFPDDELVMTTSHDESLEEVFWFSEHCAFHSSHELERTCIIHVTQVGREAEFLAAYIASQTLSK